MATDVGERPRDQETTCFVTLIASAGATALFIAPGAFPRRFGLGLLRRVQK